MAKAKDGNQDEQPIGTDDFADFISLSRAEYDRMMASAAESGANPEPAIEEGPHLDEPGIRAVKRKQMRAAGIDHESEGITDQMRDILREGDE